MVPAKELLRRPAVGTTLYSGDDAHRQIGEADARPYYTYGGVLASQVGRSPSSLDCVALAALIVQRGQGYPWVLGQYDVCDSSKEANPPSAWPGVTAVRAWLSRTLIVSLARHLCMPARPLSPWRPRQPSAAFFAPCVDGSLRPPKMLYWREIRCRDGIVSDFGTGEKLSVPSAM